MHRSVKHRRRCIQSTWSSPPHFASQKASKCSWRRWWLWGITMCVFSCSMGLMVSSPLLPPVLVLATQLHHLANLIAFVSLEKLVHSSFSIVRTAKYMTAAFLGPVVNSRIGQFEGWRHKIVVVDTLQIADHDLPHCEEICKMSKGLHIVSWFDCVVLLNFPAIRKRHTIALCFVLIFVLRLFFAFFFNNHVINHSIQLLEFSFYIKWRMVVLSIDAPSIVVVLSPTVLIHF
mmetsp:Transcript_20671/g.50769  ORF Transcript_20671/g.50769 Transcript_20671/m.50769 type:complete len:232 (-) Transcript_20671:1768-2463(-)